MPSRTRPIQTARAAGGRRDLGSSGPEVGRNQAALTLSPRTRAEVGGRGQADIQRVAAHRAGPLLAVAIQDIRTARRLRVKLLEQPLLIASCAVHTQTGPAQLRHPGDLLGAMRHWVCES